MISKQDIIATITNLNNSYSPTNQIYGLAYFLIEKGSQNTELSRKIVDIVLSSTSNNNKHLFVLEGPNKNNYFISHYANFSLNLLCYVGLKIFIQNETYRKKEIETLLEDITFFLKKEKTYLNDYSSKTVGFELIVSKYLGYVKGFNDFRFKIKYKYLSLKRQLRMSSVLAFTPEGVEGFIPSFFIERRIKKFTITPETFVLNSPETTIRYSALLNKELTDKFNKMMLDCNGLPPFFKSEYVDIFWIIDLLSNSGLLEGRINDLITAVVNESGYDKDFVGSFDLIKGFSIAKEFPLYDSDTTAMGVKALLQLLNSNIKLRSFSFNYYKNNKDSIYSSYRNDNRSSISALSHIISAQLCQGKIDESLIDYVRFLLRNSLLTDKWHTSKLYVLYALMIAFADLYNYNHKFEEDVELIIEKIMTFYNDGSFTSIEGLSGTIEESCWAVLSLKYFVKNVRSDRKLIEIIKEVQDNIRNSEIEVSRLEKLWLVKEIYNLPNVLKVLIYCAVNAK